MPEKKSKAQAEPVAKTAPDEAEYSKEHLDSVLRFRLIAKLEYRLIKKELEVYPIEERIKDLEDGIDKEKKKLEGEGVTSEAISAAETNSAAFRYQAQGQREKYRRLRALVKQREAFIEIEKEINNPNNTGPGRAKPTNIYMSRYLYAKSSKVSYNAATDDWIFNKATKPKGNKELHGLRARKGDNSDEAYIDDISSRAQIIDENPPYRSFADLAEEVLKDIYEGFNKCYGKNYDYGSGLFEALENLKKIEDKKEAKRALERAVAAMVRLNGGCRDSLKKYKEPQRVHLTGLAPRDTTQLIRFFKECAKKCRERRPLLLIDGDPGSGRNSLIDDLLNDLLDKDLITRTYAYTFSGTEERTLASALEGGQRMADEKGYRMALNELSGDEHDYLECGDVLVLRDVPANVALKMLGDIAERSNIAVIVSVVGKVKITDDDLDDDLKSLNLSDSDVETCVGYRSKLCLVRMLPDANPAMVPDQVEVIDESSLSGEALKDLVGRGIRSSGTPLGRRNENEIGDLVDASGNNIKLLEVASVAIGYSADCEKVLEALQDPEAQDPVDKLCRLIHEHPSGSWLANTLALFSFFPSRPCRIDVLAAAEDTSEGSPASIRILDAIDLERYRMARVFELDDAEGDGQESKDVYFALDGELVRRAAHRIANEKLSERNEEFLHKLSKVLSALEAESEKPELLDACVSYYENVVDVLEGLDSSLRKELVSFKDKTLERLARLYRRAGSTWHELKAREKILALRSAPVVTALREYGTLEMQYGKRADAIKTFERALGLCEGNDGLLYERALLEGKIGWTRHEMWKRGDAAGEIRNPHELIKAIEAKQRAIELLKKSKADTLDLSEACSVLANSQIESDTKEDKEKARENAEKACGLIERELGIGDREEFVNNIIDTDMFVDQILAVNECGGDAPAEKLGLGGGRRLSERQARGYARALYFYGRVLAGGDRLAEANAAAAEGGSGSTRDDLENARKYELAALKIRRRVYRPRIMLFAYNCDSLAVVCEALNKLEDAKVFSEEAWAIQQERHGDGTGSIRANYERIKEKCSAVSEAL